MYKRDYILLMVEQLGRFLNRLLFLKETERYETAYIEIDQFCRTLFALSTDEIMGLPDADLVAMHRRGDRDAEKWLALAQVLKDSGEMLDRSGELARGEERFRRALLIFLLVAVPDGKILLPELIDRIDKLVDLFSFDQLSTEIHSRLFGYLEGRGRFADAEDLLFKMIDLDAPDTLSLGLDFYRRLEAQPDDRLRAGNLPRHEISEGLSELVRRIERRKETSG